jgi:uncharacterized protein YndB with AHSA1/START domain
MSEQTVVVRKILPASREEVYDAWLDCEGMRQWMCPGPVTSAEVTLEPRVGGRLRILMKAPKSDYDHTGEFRVLDRPSKLQFTWVSPGTDHQETLVTVELHERGTQCELVLTHERFPREEAARQHEEGWGQIADKLGDYLAQSAQDAAASSCGSVKTPPPRSVVRVFTERRRTKPDDFRLAYEFDAPVDKVYQQFATEAGVRNWWTIYCEMEERVGGQASFRFPSSDFYAIVRITRLDPGRAVEWEVLDSKHPAKSGFVDLNDWVGTRIGFDMQPTASERTALRFTHSGLALKECLEVCSSAWAFFLNQSLRAYLEGGAGQPHTK